MVLRFTGEVCEQKRAIWLVYKLEKGKIVEGSGVLDGSVCERRVCSKDGRRGRECMDLLWVFGWYWDGRGFV